MQTKFTDSKQIIRIQTNSANSIEIETIQRTSVNSKQIQRTRTKSAHCLNLVTGCVLSENVQDLHGGSHQIFMKLLIQTKSANVGKTIRNQFHSANSTEIARIQHKYVNCRKIDRDQTHSTHSLDITRILTKFVNSDNSIEIAGIATKSEKS
jgi:hypothetical protein